MGMGLLNTCSDSFKSPLVWDAFGQNKLRYLLFLIEVLFVSWLEWFGQHKLR